MTAADLPLLTGDYKKDPESVYNTWFIASEARKKAFRAIRRGVIEVIKAINANTFGNDFKGSPLELVLTCITEQKQVFEGAAHPFYWKPKLLLLRGDVSLWRRLPDLVESGARKSVAGSMNLYERYCLRHFMQRVAAFRGNGRQEDDIALMIVKVRMRTNRQMSNSPQMVDENSS
jgi:hypothetical protein